MLVLLPPSEGKAVPRGRAGRPLDPGGLSLPALNPARERVLDALTALCAEPAAARTVLGLGPRQDDGIARNAALRTTPALPVGALYTGVLYDALGLANLDPSARRLVRRWVLVFSGLWGALRLTDRVPSYRCPVGVSLPGVGGLAAHWRPALTAALAETGGGPVLDLRSGPYAAMWAPPPARTVTVRVLQERLVDGVPSRVPVSHLNKATKGRLVRALAGAGARPRTAAQLVAAIRDLGYEVEEPAPGRLDLVVREL